MPAHCKQLPRDVEQLFMDGYSYDEIQNRYNISKDVVAGIIYRARQSGRVPRPVYMQAYDDRRNSYIRRGTIAGVLDRLTKEQHKHLTDEALRIGCNSLADMIAAYVLDGISEEMEQMEGLENELK